MPFFHLKKIAIDIAIEKESTQSINSEILLIFQKFKTSHDCDHAHARDNL